jgi:hypothetical protein
MNHSEHGALGGMRQQKMANRLLPFAVHAVYAVVKWFLGAKIAPNAH